MKLLRILLLTLALQSHAAVSYAPHRRSHHQPVTTSGVTSGIVGWWKMDGGSGTTAADASGNGNTGTLMGDTTWGTGPNGNGDLVFDGTADYVAVANEPNFDFERTSSFSFTAWIKVDAGAFGSRGLASKEQTFGNEPGISWRVDADNRILKCYLLQSDAQAALQAGTSVNSIAPSTWYFVALTYDGSSSGAGLKLYINNSAATTGTGTLSLSILNDNPLWIGKAPDVYEWFGEIDDFRVYNVELTAAQVSALYSGGAQ